MVILRQNCPCKRKDVQKPREVSAIRGRVASGSIINRLECHSGWYHKDGTFRCREMFLHFAVSNLQSLLHDRKVGRYIQIHVVAKTLSPRHEQDGVAFGVRDPLVNRLGSRDAGIELLRKSRIPKGGDLTLFLDHHPCPGTFANRTSDVIVFNIINQSRTSTS